MKSTETKQIKRAMVAAIAAALALGLTACGDKPSEQVTQINPPPATLPSDRPGDMAEQKQEGAPGASQEASKLPDDATLAAKVKTALTAEPELKSLSINVDTVAGVVTLKGTADSQEKRQRAEQVASRVEGVRSVRNEVIVVKG